MTEEQALGVCLLLFFQPEETTSIGWGLNDQTDDVAVTV